MKKTILASAISLLALSAGAQEKDNTLTVEEFAQGWELIFDGESLKGWKAYNGDAPRTWRVDENAIHCDGSKGGDDIMTVAQYEDFDFMFEWKIEKSGNSGVIYRVREGKQWDKPYHTGPEFQVFDDPGSFDKNSTGSFYDVYPPSTDKKLNPALQWNTGRIRVSKGLITHWVNGAIVMQCQLYSDDWNAKVAKSKWADVPFYGRSPFGHIDFQNHGSKVWYKNLKVRKL